MELFRVLIGEDEKELEEEKVFANVIVNKRECDKLGDFAYRFNDVATDELEREDNSDLRQMIIDNITNLQSIFVELIKRSAEREVLNEK